MKSKRTGMPHIVKRMLCFCGGVAVNSVGIALITKSNLGTSPISSVPWVITLHWPAVSFGMTTFVLNAVFILVQAVLLRRDFHAVQLLQIVVNVVFSALLDISMAALWFFNPETWWLRGLGLLLGCTILAFGICMEVSPGLITVPGEGIVRAIAIVTKIRFGTVKVCFDVSLIVLSSVMSFVFFGRLNGVGVGTVIAAVITGQIVNFFNRRVRFVGAIERGVETPEIGD
ncbi:YczE/YyaS/YitT family protein [Bifidobacterium pluvialisilvae]|uniref:YczE/YyaS/YitT family protein n=1 Tax=Bifidobacterium pluvialisilvae TaxID=2834436 RepID=UPI001F38E3D3|nr:DUF6198 family protein [Bifidobacterium pluvialisilvae]